VLISSGELDPIVPPDHPPRLAAQLRAGGAEVALETQPVSHQLTRGDLELAQAWLRQTA
jgi:predicted esterase